MLSGCRFFERWVRKVKLCTYMSSLNNIEEGFKLVIRATSTQEGRGEKGISISREQIIPSWKNQCYRFMD